MLTVSFLVFSIDELCELDLHVVAPDVIVVGYFCIVPYREWTVSGRCYKSIVITVLAIVMVFSYASAMGFVALNTAPYPHDNRYFAYVMKPFFYVFLVGALMAE